MEELEEKLYAFIYDKIDIGEGQFVFKPNIVACGEIHEEPLFMEMDFGDNIDDDYDESEDNDSDDLSDNDEGLELDEEEKIDIFVDEQGNEWLPISTINVLDYEGIDRGYYKTMTTSEIMLKYNVENQEELTKILQTILYENIIVGTIDYNNESIKMVEIPRILDGMENIYDKSVDVIVDEKNGESEISVSVPEKDIEDLFYNDNISDIKEYLSFILEGIKKAKDGYPLIIEAISEKKEHDKKQEELEYAFKDFSDADNSDDLEKDNKEKIRKLYTELKKRIIGQDEAIDSVIYSIAMDEMADSPRSKKRVLLAGPTGSGKTEIINTISEIFDKPTVHVDSTQKTAPGYVGAKLTDDLVSLISKSGGDLEKAKKGIIVFDEIDKKGTKSNGDVHGKDIINQILRFCDGTDYTITYTDKNGEKRKTIFNTGDLTIIACGAFPEVFEMKKIKEKGKIGFAVSYEKNDDKISLTPNEIAEYGLMGREFVGRFPVIATLNRLTEKELGEILVKSELSPLKIQKETLKKYGINLIYDENFIKSVSKKAYELNTGGRGLNNIIDSMSKKMITDIVVKSDDELQELKEEDGTITLFATEINDEPVILNKKEKEELTEKFNNNNKQKIDNHSKVYVKSIQ